MDYSVTKKLLIKISFQDKKGKASKKFVFTRKDDYTYDSQVLKIKFSVIFPKIQYKLAKLFSGKLTICFNPRLIAVELEDGFLEGNSGNDYCYKHDEGIRVNIFNIYSASQDEVGNSLNFVIQPLQETKAEIHINIISEKSALFTFFLRRLVRIEKRPVTIIGEAK